MEQPLSLEIIKRLGQWPVIEETASKTVNTKILIQENNADEQISHVKTGGDDENANEEDENPALEGHFLTERCVLDVAVIDSCQCTCHKDHNMTFEFNLPFSCSKCSQQFCCKCQFLVHRDFHRGERKYACQECGKSYYYKSDLVRHQPVHSNIKPHECKICGRSFNQVGHLITHRLVHTGEKPFPCDVCHKPFNRKSNLQKHKMIHTGERPFSCLVCGARFSRKGDLQRHTMLHTGERPYKCEICSKTFSQKPHLVSHMSVHTGERPYKCLACGKSFNRKSNLIKHQITKCPALSLKRTDGSDLQLSDLTPIASSSFLSHFNQLLGNKLDLSDSGEARIYYENIEIKPVASIDGTSFTLTTASDESSSIHSQLSETPSLLRARLSTVNTDDISDMSSKSKSTVLCSSQLAKIERMQLTDCSSSNVHHSMNDSIARPPTGVVGQELSEPPTVLPQQESLQHHVFSGDSGTELPNTVANNSESSLCSQEPV